MVPSQTLVGMSNLNLASCQLISLEISLQFLTKEAAFSICAAGDSTAITSWLIHLIVTHLLTIVIVDSKNNKEKNNNIVIIVFNTYTNKGWALGCFFFILCMKFNPEFK